MYRYYQRGTSSTERWHPVPEKKALELIAKASVDMVTVLSVSDISSNVPQSDLRYKGDLYFDIDHADINVAIESAKTLVARLQDLGVATPQVYLSGKKGLHIIVDARVFSDGKAATYLPYIYGLIAQRLDVEGLDHAVYSGGKGRMWRQPNRERKDTKTYKVPITVDELYELDASSYAAYVSQPRPNIKHKVDKSPSVDLMQLFMESKQECEALMAESSLTITEPDERLADLDLQSEPPGCLVNLVEGVNVKTKNFNRAAMNFTGLLKALGADDEAAKPLIDRFVSHNNYNSVTYNTPQKRYSHVRQILKRSAKDPNLGFTPSFLFSSIDRCSDGCVLCDGTLSDKEQSEEDTVAGNSIVVINGCYFARGLKNDRRLSTFTINPVSYSVLYDEDEDINLRDSIFAEIHYNVGGEQKVKRKEIPESAWSSLANFKRCIEGIGNVVWFGTDNDLMMLKHFLFSRDLAMTEIRKSGKVGLRLEDTDEGRTLVYIEPTTSLNSFGELDTHTLTSNIPASPRALQFDSIEEEELGELYPVLSSMLRMNAPDKAALMIGWFIAAHLKPHFQTLTNQFCILSIWGNAGSGKSLSAGLLGHLHGCDYTGADSPASLGGTTPWAAAEFVASSTSTPRLLDEFNRAKLERGGKYAKIADLVKAAWGNQPHMRGTVNKTKSGGAEVATLHMSGPVVIMSEQQPDEPPIMQRCIQVQLSRKGRRGCEADWENVYDNRDYLSRVAKHMVLQAVRTPLGWVKERLDHWREPLPSETVLDSRPHYSFRVVLTGLDFFAKVAVEQLGYEPDHPLIKEIGEAQQAIVDSITGNVKEISKEKSVSVCDRVISFIGLVAAQSADGGSPGLRLESGTHYMRSGDDLYLDMTLCFTAALRYSHSVRQPLEVTSVKMLETLIRDEDYFVSSKAEASFCPRKVWKLDAKALADKGIDVTLFTDDL